MSNMKVEKIKHAVEAIGHSSEVKRDLGPEKLARIETMVDSVRDDLLKGNMTMDDFRKGLANAPAESRELFLRAGGRDFKLESASAADAAKLFDSWGNAIHPHNGQAVAIAELEPRLAAQQVNTLTEPKISGTPTARPEEVGEHLRDATVALLQLFARR